MKEKRKMAVVALTGTEWSDEKDSTIVFSDTTVVIDGPYWQSIGIKTGTYQYAIENSSVIQIIANGKCYFKLIEFSIDGRLMVQEKSPHYFLRMM
jgi:hypothetical protein